MTENAEPTRPETAGRTRRESAEPTPPGNGEPTRPENAGSAGPEPAPPAVDPMKGFRGVAAGALVLEAIVVALSLLVVAKLDGGLVSWVGIVVGLVIVALLALCALLRRRWSLPAVCVVQLALIGCFPGSVGVGAIGVLFALIWAYLLYLRWDVARRMAAGRLPSQQSNRHSW